MLYDVIIKCDISFQAVSAAQRELSGCGERSEEADTDPGDIGEDEAAR